MDANYQVCTRCVMDSSAQDFSLSEEGCNFCSEYSHERLSKRDQLTGAFQPGLDRLVERIKSDGVGKPYDCIIGVSGGVDSSWVLYQAVALGLRPLAVHMDNGWNSELATHNIRELLATLGVDLWTYVIEWNEYRALLRAFMDSDVVDLELLYDNAATAVCYREASRYGLKYILSGSNSATEGLRMPARWSWRDKRDARNIRAIARSRGIRLDSFPTFSNWNLLINRIVRKIEWIPFLDYADYSKERALRTLEAEIGFRRYPYKHYESVFTRFYQGYILPTKFGVDKRKVHLSTLVMTSQLTRDEALELLNQDAYGSQEDLGRDRKFVLKKLAISEEDFGRYLGRPERSHAEWGSETTSLFSAVLRFGRAGLRILRKLDSKRELFHRKLKPSVDASS